MSESVVTFKRERGVVTDYWSASLQGKSIRVKWTTSAGTVTTKSNLCRSEDEAAQRLRELVCEKEADGFVATSEFIEPPKDLEKIPDDEISLLRSLEYAKFNFNGPIITPRLQKRLAAVYARSGKLDSKARLEDEIRRTQERSLTGGLLDKAKWHYERNFPDELPRTQAFVHIGYFVAWLVTRDLFNAELFDTPAQEKALAKLKKRELAPSQFVEKHCDGVLSDEMVAENALAFTSDYYNSDYLADYEELLSRGLPSIYHTKDDWNNFEKMAQRIDERFSAYESQLKK